MDTTTIRSRGVDLDDELATGMRRIEAAAAVTPPVSLASIRSEHKQASAGAASPAIQAGDGSAVARAAAAAATHNSPNLVEIDREEQMIRSHLAEGEVIEGNLRLKFGISIAGKVTGEVISDTGTVVIERTGEVGVGVRSSGNIIVDGQVGSPENAEKNDPDHPAIHTPNALIVLGGGRVYGRHEYGRIATYDDATIEGMGKKIKG